MSVLNDTHWQATLHLNAVRVVSATITLMILFLLGKVFGVLSGPHWAGVSIVDVLTIPAALLVVGLAIIGVCRVAGKMGVPMIDAVAGIMSLVMIVFIAVGDPLIWVVRKYYPGLVPVQEFKFVNPNAVIMVNK